MVSHQAEHSICPLEVGYCILGIIMDYVTGGDDDEGGLLCWIVRKRVDCGDDWDGL